jgi:predicted transglutaminase-like cysteine proteinase
MKTTGKIILAALVMLAVCRPDFAVARSAAPSHMPVTGRTSQPIGHYEYCRKYRSDCNLRSDDTRPVQLTSTLWKELESVNQSTNKTIRPVTDQEYYNQEEYWAYPKKYGDCEDYVLLKRYLLLERGWPASSLLVTVVRQPNGDGHAVLTVRTDAADFILDNLRDKILPWNKTEYRYLKRQSAANSGLWEGINDSRDVMVGSVGR